MLVEPPHVLGLGAAVEDVREREGGDAGAREEEVLHEGEGQDVTVLRGVSERGEVEEEKRALEREGGPGGAGARSSRRTGDELANFPFPLPLSARTGRRRGMQCVSTSCGEEKSSLHKNRESSAWGEPELGRVEAEPSDARPRERDRRAPVAHGLPVEPHSGDNGEVPQLVGRADVPGARRDALGELRAGGRAGSARGREAGRPTRGRRDAPAARRR